MTYVRLARLSMTRPCPVPSIHTFPSDHLTRSPLGCLPLGVKDTHCAVVLMHPVEVHESIFAWLIHGEFEHCDGAGYNYKVFCLMNGIGGVSTGVDRAEQR